MKMILLATLFLFAFVLSGCLDGNQGEDDLKLYKGISTAEIPGECLQFKDDVCGLFDCMVEMCWCDDGHFPSPIIKEGSSTVQNEEEAVNAVQAYVTETGSEYSDVQRAVNLGDNIHRVFFNVFAYNEAGDEKVFTVAADGTILLTICGV